MDGTLANLYAIENWEAKLRAEDSTPYEEAEPMLALNQLARVLNKLQAAGHEIGIISWLSKEATTEYNKAVRKAKRKWLAIHLPSVVWDEIHLVKYGTPKHFCCQGNDKILFDDNIEVREKWNKYGQAFSENDIIEVLKKFL